MSAGGTAFKASRHILVIRLGAMGDVLHTLPAVASLKHSLASSHLTWVIEPRWAPLLRDNRFVDRVVQLDRRSWRSIRQAWAELREFRFDVAVDFQGLIKSALVSFAAGPDRTYGFHKSQLRESVAALFYSDSAMARADHIVDRNLDLAAAAGATNILRTFPLPPGEAEGELPPSGFVLASPLAGWKSKQWPAEYYDDVRRQLRRDCGLELVLNGPPGSGLANISSLAGLIHATRRAVAVVGVDSGPMHLAAALGKPGVAIFGPTDPLRNGPYGGTIRVLRDASAVTTYKRGETIDASMRAITPDEVLTALKPQLATQRAGA